MGAAPGSGSGWEDGEFEFKLVFEEDPPERRLQGPAPVRAAEPESSGAGEEESSGALLHLDSTGSSLLGQNLLFSL